MMIVMNLQLCDSECNNNNNNNNTCSVLYVELHGVPRYKSTSYLLLRTLLLFYVFC